MRATTSGSLFELLMWPWQAARLGSDLAETMISTQRVLGARLPMIANAIQDPISADRRELTRMVTEKSDAFAASGRTAATARNAVRKAAVANAAALGRASGGDPFWLADWFRLMQTNVDAATAMFTLPAAALAPVHRTVTANDRRLGRSRRRKA